MQSPLHFLDPAPLLPFAGIGPFAYTEMFVVAMAALMIFGSRLPEVALRAVAHIMRARRAVTRMWRETGLEEELRRVRRDIELNLPRDADFDIKRSSGSASSNEARAAAERAREAAERTAREAEQRRLDGTATGLDDPADHVDPDAERAGEVRIEPAEGVVASGDEWDDPPEEAPVSDVYYEDPSGPALDPGLGFGEGIGEAAGDSRAPADVDADPVPRTPRAPRTHGPAPFGHGVGDDADGGPQREPA